MIRELDPSDDSLAARIVEIQRAGYAVEAALIGFDGIPQLTETAEHVASLTSLHWRGVFEADHLAGLIAWERSEELIDIDRLAIDPEYARRGHGRRLVQSVPTDLVTIVSTGSENEPAARLYQSEGFVETGRTEIAPGIFTTQFSRDGR